VGSLERRIQGLEAALTSDECPVCGLDPDAPPEYVVVWEDVCTEDLKGETDEPEFCDNCGQQLEYVVVWDDLNTYGRPEQEEREHDD
jgi:hypothetical protein